MLLSDSFFSWFATYKWLTVVEILVLAALSTERVFVGHFYGKVVDSASKGNQRDFLRYFVILNVVWLTSQLLGSFLNLLQAFSIPLTKSLVRSVFVKAVFNTVSTNFREVNVGNLLSKLVRFPSSFSFLVSLIQQSMLSIIISVVSSFVYLSHYSRVLGWVFLSSFLLVVLSFFPYVVSGGEDLRKVNKLHGEAHEWAEDLFSNMFSAVSYNQERRENEAAAGVFSGLAALETRVMIRHSLFRALYAFLFVGVFVLNTFVTYRLYVSGKIDLSTVASVFVILYSSLGTLSSAYWLVREMMEELSVAKDIDNAFPFVTPPGGTAEMPRGGEIVMKDFVFTQNGFKMVVRNLVVRPGERVVLVGKVGSGKSTLAKVVTRTTVPESWTGSFTVGGVPAYAIDLESYRRAVAFVPQAAELFDRTLFENVTYGNDGVSEEDIYLKMEEMGLSSLVPLFKSRMSEPVGKKGSFLSGGQRQVVLTLRALLCRDLSLLVFDEPTASLDKDAKSNFFHTLLDRIPPSVSVLVVTHDAVGTGAPNLRLVSVDRGVVV